MDRQEEIATIYENVRYANQLFAHLAEGKQINLVNINCNMPTLYSAVSAFKETTGVYAVSEFLKQQADSLNYKIYKNDNLMVMYPADLTNYHEQSANYIMEKIRWPNKNRQKDVRQKDAEKLKYTLLTQISLITLFQLLFTDTPRGLELNAVTVQDWKDAIDKNLSNLLGNKQLNQRILKDVQNCFDNLNDTNKTSVDSQYHFLVNEVLTKILVANKLALIDEHDQIIAEKRLQVVMEKLLVPEESWVEKLNQCLNELNPLLAHNKDKKEDSANGTN